MNKYIIEHPIEISFSLKPLCSLDFNKDPEGECVSLYFNYVEINANSLIFGNEDVFYKLDRDMKLYEDFDLEIPIGVEVFSEESNFEKFEIFDGVVINHTFDNLLNYVVTNMLPVDETINKERDRLNKIKHSKIIGGSNITSAKIIGGSMHNLGLRLSGKGLVM